MNAELYGYHPQALSFEDWKWPPPKGLHSLTIHSFDLVFLRLPEPSSPNFFRQLEAHFPEVLWINRPGGILKVGSKKFLTQVPTLCPPVQWLKSSREAISLSKTMDIVLKPLRNYGGKGLLKIQDGLLYEGNTKKEFEELNTLWDGQDGMLAMKYLPFLKEGDKRTVVANGHIEFSTVRYPPANSWICNVAQGGRSEMSQPSLEEIEIAQVLTPILKDEGVVLFGFDTLVDDSGKRKLSEINVQSIGGIVPAENKSGEPISDRIVQHLLDYAFKKISPSKTKQ
jgi:glutathione synthase